MKPPSDAELMGRVRSGDDEAFAELRSRHAAAALVLARRYRRSRVESTELVNDVFRRVHASLQQGRGPDVGFRLYLLDEIRRAGDGQGSGSNRRRTEPFPPQDSGDAVVRAFRSLPERVQTVLWHTEIEGDPASVVARHLGIHPNLVAAFAYNARERLRRTQLRIHISEEEASPCRLVLERLDAYSRDVLTAAERVRVQRHLRGCTGCEAVRLGLADVAGELARSMAPHYLGRATGSYLELVASRNHGEATTPPRVAASARPVTRRWPIRTAAAATIIAAGAATWLTAAAGPSVGPSPSAAARVDAEAPVSADSPASAPADLSSTTLAEAPPTTSPPAPAVPSTPTTAPAAAASRPSHPASAPPTTPAPTAPPQVTPSPAPSAPSATLPPPAPAPPVTMAPASPPPSADLSVAVAVAANNRTFTTTVSNHGPSSAVGVWIEFTFRYVPPSVPVGCTADMTRRTVGCSLGQVAIGQRPSVTITTSGVADLIGLVAGSATADPNALNNAWRLVSAPAVVERSGPLS